MNLRSRLGTIILLKVALAIVEISGTLRRYITQRAPRRSGRKFSKDHRLKRRYIHIGKALQCNKYLPAPPLELPVSTFLTTYTDDSGES
ncbi:hypothetical protein BDQ17DRAFT_1360520, partial [Cyathus striatus]